MRYTSSFRYDGWQGGIIREALENSGMHETLIMSILQNMPLHFTAHLGRYKGK